MQAKVAIHSPRIKYSHRQNLLLKAENNSIKQKLSAFSGELMFKEGTLSQVSHKIEERCVNNILGEIYN
jgi:hypothetical protein